MTTPKDVAYFQDLDKYQQQLRAENYYAYEPIIKNSDQLLITVSAPVLNQQDVAQFNLPMTTFLAPGETTIGQSASIQTYMVEKDGSINFPVIGKIQLGGLTKTQAIEQITQLVSKFLEDPVVNLRIISFKVTVLGEVIKPGPVEVKDERISILDALGAAGDLTIYGDRKNVYLIRDNNGTIEHVKFDLTKSDLFASPYYYLQQNDLVVVEPNQTRKRESNYGTAESYRNSMLSISFTAVSVIVSFLSIFLRK
ncbi:polysaccharide biosynthesis protein [Bacteroidia bacterium]|nr:polysaccharide biosynthesis protein [Bacteroidia bacterium]